jgi:hypothetical protein
MRAADALIDQIVSSSQIPSEKRRREVARELRSHVDDFVAAARGAGHQDNEIERMVLENFGDPRQVGRNFAWVYRRQRAVLHALVFGISTFAVAILTAAGILTAQAGIAKGFHLPFAIGSRHTIAEVSDIAATVAAYAGLVWVEKLFTRRPVLKSMAVLVLLAAVALQLRISFLPIGCLAAAFLRLSQVVLHRAPARFVVTAACFGLCGVWLWTRWPSAQYSAWASFASWLAMGLGYQWMTDLAPRIDRGLSQTLQRL